MELKGYIIEKYNNMTDAYTCNRMVYEANLLGIDIKIIGIHDCLVSDKGIFNRGERLEKRDFLINRYKWGKIKDQINELAKRSYNSTDAFNLYINKYEQVRKLKSEEFIIPQYVLGTGQIPYMHLAKELGEPIVAKGLESSMGEEICLIKSQEEMNFLLEKYGDKKEWLFEEFISSSLGRDMRFYSIRGEVIAAMQRRSKGDFRANVALGASVEAFEITDRMRMIARDIYRETGLDFLGIDLMFGSTKPYFCEINVMPGIEGIERATKVNVAKRIIETIAGDFD